MRGVQANPKNPAVLKILRVVNLLRAVNLLSPCDLLSRRTLCGHPFPGNDRHFPSQRRVPGIVNLGGIVKTLRRRNFTIFAIVVVFLVRKGPLGRCGPVSFLPAALGIGPPHPTASRVESRNPYPPSTRGIPPSLPTPQPSRSCLSFPKESAQFSNDFLSLPNLQAHWPKPNEKTKVARLQSEIGTKAFSELQISLWKMLRNPWTGKSWFSQDHFRGSKMQLRLVFLRPWHWSQLKPYY